MSATSVSNSSYSLFLAFARLTVLTVLPEETWFPANVKFETLDVLFVSQSPFRFYELVTVMTVVPWTLRSMCLEAPFRVCLELAAVCVLGLACTNSNDGLIAPALSGISSGSLLPSFSSSLLLSADGWTWIKPACSRSLESSESDRGSDWTDWTYSSSASSLRLNWPLSKLSERCSTIKVDTILLIRGKWTAV